MAVSIWMVGRSRTLSRTLSRTMTDGEKEFDGRACLLCLHLCMPAGSVSRNSSMASTYILSRPHHYIVPPAYLQTSVYPQSPFFRTTYLQNTCGNQFLYTFTLPHFTSTPQSSTTHAYMSLYLQYLSRATSLYLPVLPHLHTYSTSLVFIYIHVPILIYLQQLKTFRITALLRPHLNKIRTDT